MKQGGARRPGELEFLRRLLPTLPQGRTVIVGPGDDCAVVRGTPPTLLTTDALVEGTHFERDWLTPRQIGAKSLLVNLSDIAAMGGVPELALLSVGVPADFSVAELEALHRGAAAAARAAGVSIVGGNLSSSAGLFVSVTLVGKARTLVLRRGARRGDLVYVSGTLGDAALAVEILRSRQKPAGAAFLLRRFAAPSPRLALGRALADSRIASAMIDVSDGVVQDLGHICTQSHVGAVVVESELPRSRAYQALAGDDPDAALYGGEDYELLFTVPPARRRRVQHLAARVKVPITCIGEIVAHPLGVRLRRGDGRLSRPARSGFEHFRRA